MIVQSPTATPSTSPTSTPWTTLGQWRPGLWCTYIRLFLSSCPPVLLSSYPPILLSSLLLFLLSSFSPSLSTPLPLLLFPTITCILTTSPLLSLYIMPLHLTLSHYTYTYHHIGTHYQKGRHPPDLSRRKRSYSDSEIPFVLPHSRRRFQSVSGPV